MKESSELSLLRNEDRRSGRVPQTIRAPVEEYHPLGFHVMTDNSVISLSAQSELLAHREAALRSCGYEVLSTTSAIEVRFEVEMGRYGVLFLCYTRHQTIHADLAGLFMRSCPLGSLHL